MAQINITINGRLYDIGCDHGQEARVLDLASYIDGKVQQIARSGGASNDVHLMVLTALVLADELFEAQEIAARLGRAAPPAAPESPFPADGMSVEDEQALADCLTALAKRIESIAARVQKAA